MALPLALFGLVAMSLLVSTALLTSSTELAISRAHQDATVALYVAEGGMNAYVAERGLRLSEAADKEEFLYAPPGSGDSVWIGVTHLATVPLPDQAIRRVYALTSRPMKGGGRMLSALIPQTIPPPVPLSLAITSAMTVGGDLTVNGNAFHVSGLSDACGGPGVEALRLAADSELNLGSTQQYEERVSRFEGLTDEGTAVAGEGAIERAGSRAELVSSILGGRTLDEIAAQVPASQWRYRLRSPLYTGEWLSSVLGGSGGVAVVDAEGGTIAVPPGSYTGLLLVLNGSVSLSGNVTFQGIILAERNFSLSGSVQVNGAILSLATEGENVVENTGDDSTLGSGSINVQYDLCQVQAATQAYGKVTQEQQTPALGPLQGWMEVVR